MKFTFSKSFIFITAFIFFAFVVVIAGTLAPIFDVNTATNYTLLDINNLIVNNSTTTEGNHNVSTTSFPLATTSFSISEIYAKLANLIQREDIKTGVTYLGITGDYGNPDLDRVEVVPIYPSLESANTPEPVGYSLENIYDLIVNNATTTVGSHNLSTTSVASASMHSLSDIYTELSTLILPENVATGTVYLGVTGTYDPCIDDPITGFKDGDGSSGDPYQVCSCTQLQNINTSVSSYYKLIDNIDCSETVTWNGGAGFLPLGYEGIDSFSGDFNGNKKTISGLTINRPTTNYVGLFSRTNGASIYDFGLIDVNITGQDYVGAAVGHNYGPGYDLKTYRIYSSGEVSGRDQVGGLIGTLRDIKASDVYSVATVSGVNSIGGVSGTLEFSQIFNAYSTGSVSGSELVGGLIGRGHNAFNDTYAAKIFNSFATGNVSGSSKVGGLVGGMTIDSCGQIWVVSNSGWYKHAGNPDASIGWDQVTNASSTPTTYNIKSGGGEGWVDGDQSWFYDSTQNIYDTTAPVWDFGTVWVGDGLNYPILRQ